MFHDALTCMLLKSTMHLKSYPSMDSIVVTLVVGLLLKAASAYTTNISWFLAAFVVYVTLQATFVPVAPVTIGAIVHRHRHT